MSPSHESSRMRSLTERDEEERVARLLAAAGPPPPAPELEIARIQEAARSEWRRRYAWRRHQRRMHRRQLAAAAVAVAAIGVFAWWRSTPRPPLAPATLAAVELASGEATFVPRAGALPWRPLAANAPLAAGAVVKTAAGGAPARVALRWSDGRSLRLDVASELVLAAADRVELVRGGVYVDSRGAPAGGAPAVATPRGSFREIGTQFEVRVTEGAAANVRLRVRDGEVAWRDDGRAATAEAGVELVLAADGSLTRGRVAPHDAEWAWVLAAARPPAIEGWPLERFLAWYGRESGLAVVYADAESRELAAAVVVHGTVAHLGAEEALAAVLASSGFTARVEGGALVAAAGDGPQR